MAFRFDRRSQNSRDIISETSVELLKISNFQDLEKGRSSPPPPSKTSEGHRHPDEDAEINQDPPNTSVYLRLLQACGLVDLCLLWICLPLAPAHCPLHSPLASCPAAGQPAPTSRHNADPHHHSFPTTYPSSFSTGLMPGSRPTCTHNADPDLPLLVLHWLCAQTAAVSTSTLS